MNYNYLPHTFRLFGREVVCIELDGQTQDQHSATLFNCKLLSFLCLIDPSCFSLQDALLYAFLNEPFEVTGACQLNANILGSQLTTCSSQLRRRRRHSGKHSYCQVLFVDKHEYAQLSSLPDRPRCCIANWKRPTSNPSSSWDKSSCSSFLRIDRHRLSVTEKQG